MPTDLLAHGVGSGDNLASAPSYSGGGVRGACQPIPNSQGPHAKRSVGIYTSQ